MDGLTPAQLKQLKTFIEETDIEEVSDEIRSLEPMRPHYIYLWHPAATPLRPPAQPCRMPIVRK